MKYHGISRFAVAGGALVLLMAMFASSAVASPYKVQTNAATDIGAYSATLNGEVYVPQNTPGWAGFAYGTTTEYGSEPERVALGAQTGWVQVAIVVDDLQPATTYHFKFGAITVTGELSEGKDLTFTTSSLLPKFIPGEGIYPANLSAEQSSSDPVAFSVENGSLSCEQFGGTGALTLSEVLSGESHEITLAPVFSECEALGQTNASVVTNGCTYRVYAGDPSTATTGMDIVCPEGKAIEVSTGTCAFSIPGQSGLESITASNETAEPGFVNLDLNVSQVKYTKTKDGLLCKFNGTGAKEDGGLAGSEILTATDQSEAKMSMSIGY